MRCVPFSPRPHGPRLAVPSTGIDPYRHSLDPRPRRRDHGDEATRRHDVAKVGKAPLSETGIRGRPAAMGYTVVAPRLQPSRPFPVTHLAHLPPRRRTLVIGLLGVPADRYNTVFKFANALAP